MTEDHRCYQDDQRQHHLVRDTAVNQTLDQQKYDDESFYHVHGASLNLWLENEMFLSLC